MHVKTATEGKTKDVAITDVTPENYIVPSNEQHLYHCVIEVRKFDSETGKRLSVPRIQKFGKKSFENGILDALKKTGLHDYRIARPQRVRQGASRGKSGTNRRTAESRRGKSRRRCKGKGRSRGESQSRGKSGVKG